MLVQIIIYFIFFIIGIVLGSFFTLATYRIPLKQDITHTRSYCPKCNHELGFFDLIPVLSYLFLGGKCRYCSQKISPRYIIMEVLSGLIYLILIYLLKIDFLQITVFEMIKILYITLMYATVFILCGIFKETKKISLGTTIFGMSFQILYIIYLYILNINIYRYIIYLVILFIILIIGIMKKEVKNEIKE